MARDTLRCKRQRGSERAGVCCDPGESASLNSVPSAFHLPPCGLDHDPWSMDTMSLLYSFMGSHQLQSSLKTPRTLTCTIPSKHASQTQLFTVPLTGPSLSTCKCLLKLLPCPLPGFQRAKMYLFLHRPLNCSHSHEVFPDSEYPPSP